MKALRHAHGPVGRTTARGSAVALIAAGLLMTSPASAGGGGWGPATDVDASPGRIEQCGRGALETDGVSRLYVVTRDWGVVGDEDSVRFVRSLDGGATWTDRVRLSDAAHGASHAALADAGALVHVVWAHGAANYPRSSVMVRTNTSYGAPSAWRSAVRLTPASGKVGEASIAAYRSSVYVAVTRMYAASGGRVVLFTSRDKGRTWSHRTIGRIDASRARQISSRPSVVVTRGTVAVAWLAKARRTRVAVVRTSLDRGASFSPLKTFGPARWLAADGHDGRLAVTGLTRTSTAGPGWVRVWSHGRWAPRRLLPGTWSVEAVPALTGEHTLGVARTSYVGVRPRQTTVIHWEQSGNDGRTWQPSQRVSMPGEPVWHLCAAGWSDSGQVHVLSSGYDVETDSAPSQVLLHTRS